MTRARKRRMASRPRYHSGRGGIARRASSATRLWLVRAWAAWRFLNDDPDSPLSPRRPDAWRSGPLAFNGEMVVDLSNLYNFLDRRPRAPRRAT
jgi:hypothetical protein